VQVAEFCDGVALEPVVGHACYQDVVAVGVQVLADLFELTRGAGQTVYEDDGFTGLMAVGQEYRAADVADLALLGVDDCPDATG